MSRTIVYGLIDPRTLMIRYVGKSSSGLWRPKQHIKKAGKTTGPYCANWLVDLVREGICYEIVVLQEPSREELNDCERWWIAYGRASGWPLTNLTDGGEGALGRVIDDEHRAIMSKHAKAMWEDEEMRASLVALAKERMNRPDVVESNRARGIARTSSPEVRAELSARATLQFSTPEAREQLVLRGLRQAREPEMIARMCGPSNPAKSPEARTKISTAARDRLADLDNRARLVALQSTPEARKAASEKAKTRLADPDNREAQKQRVLRRDNSVHRTPEARAAYAARTLAYYADPANREKARASAQLREARKREQRTAL